ncbi:MAG: excinuclease ABC subunit UvrC [Spirochaetota bacterium]
MRQPETELQLKLAQFPLQPGVYLMKDDTGEIIYIGKAGSLRKRVSSYFQKADLDPKTRVLVRSVADMEYIMTDSEIEALLLENTLIKRHKPKYNIRLKDDKKYPYIMVKLDEEYPRLVFTRRLAQDGNRYFGPYTDARAARQMITTINTTFKLKTCSRPLPLKEHERSCLNYQINRCHGICRGTMSAGEYRAIVETAMRFLEGNIDPVIDDLGSIMDGYAARLEYEKAARMRDVIADIRKITGDQKVLAPVGSDQDFVGLASGGDEAVVLLFEFRAGALVGRKIFVYENAKYSLPGEIIQAFLVEYYRGAEIPPRIVISSDMADRSTVAEYLGSLASRKTVIALPRTADEKGILQMVQKNIDLVMADRDAHRKFADKERGLSELADALGLGGPPEVIDCFDISNIQGKHAVASMIEFRGGIPDKKNYRRFRIRGYEGANDPGMIHEAVGRRLQHLMNEGIPFPDLIIVDGGPAQLARAMEARDALGTSVAIISLAKRLEEVYHGPKAAPLRLAESPAALKILQAARDEAHRFAIGYHRSLRDRSMTSSVVDSIPGIGEKKRALLLRNVPEPARIPVMTLDEITLVPGIGKKTAEIIYRHFHREETE